MSDQLVIVKRSEGYPDLCNGMVCKLVEVIPRYTDPETPWFTWPEYYTVENSQGEKVTAHAKRFEKISN